MGLLDKLEKQGSTLTDADGDSPTKMDLSSQATRIFNKSQLDLNGKKPEQMDLSSKFEKDLALSQLDLDGKTPSKYLDNPPR